MLRSLLIVLFLSLFAVPVYSSADVYLDFDNNIQQASSDTGQGLIPGSDTSDDDTYAASVYLLKQIYCRAMACSLALHQISNTAPSFQPIRGPPAHLV
jgi:hypothetical protein